MRDLVMKKSFIVRKYVDTALNWLFPNNWIPLYSTVTFSRMPYRDCIKNKAWQDKVMKVKLNKILYKNNLINNGLFQVLKTAAICTGSVIVATVTALLAYS